MQYKIVSEQPFQVLCSSFSISPSQQNYTLNISADGVNYSPLFTVASGQTRLVTGVASGSYYKLIGNQSNVTINWVRSCSEGGSGGGGNAGELEPVTEFPLGAAEGTVVALVSGDTMGVYQYDGTEWVPVGGGNIDELVEMLQAKEEVIASAITELHESIPDMSNYWTSGETKSYVDGAVGALADDVADIERVTATALTELHDSILDLSGATADFVTSGDVETLISAATEDYVTTADTQEIIDRLQTVETVASSAFDYLETMMETKEEVIAEALTDLEDTKVGSEDIKHIVKLTQAEYDLIATPDPETLYIIVNA